MKWLLDEMLPPATAGHLRDRGHDAVAVVDAGLGSADDPEVFAHAVADGRTVVTENFADYAKIVQERQARDEACVPVLFVRRDALPARGAMASHLARRLDAWAAANPEPFVGLYWL